MSFNITAKEILPRLIHLHFETRYEITSTMMRIQEYYESPYPNIMNKIFDVETYMDAYAKEMGNFTYNTDWSGFNIPGNIVNDFFAEYYDILLKKEINLRNVIDQSKTQFNINKNIFYIIASYDDKDNTEHKDVLKHEIAHGLFYLNDNYKEEMESVVCIPGKNTELLVDKLKEKGYAEHVIYDEMQAYFSTSEMTQLCEDFDTEEIPWERVFKCKKIFEEYYSEIEN